MLVATWQDPVVDESRLCVHAGELDDRLAPDRVIRASDVDKGAFISYIGADKSLKYDLGIRDEDTIAAFSYPDLSAEKFGCIAEFFPRGHPRAAGKGHGRVCPDCYRNREFFPFCQGLFEHDVGMPAFHKPGHDMVVVKDLHTMDRCILNAFVPGEDDP